MSTSASACFRRAVTARSAALGSALPLGWLWPTITAAALCSERAAHDFARMHFGAVDGAAEQFLERQRAMAGVEEQHREHFMRMAAQALGEIAAGGAGVGQRLAAFQAGGEVAVAQFQRGGERAGARRPEARQFRQSARRRSSSARSGPCAFSSSRAVATASRPRRPEPRKIASSSASDSTPAPRREQFFAGAFGGGPVADVHGRSVRRRRGFAASVRMQGLRVS